jgi:hypothetical protein
MSVVALRDAGAGSQISDLGCALPFKRLAGRGRVTRHGRTLGGKRFGARLFNKDMIIAILRNKFDATYATGDDRGTVKYYEKRFACSTTQPSPTLALFVPPYGKLYLRLQPALSQQQSGVTNPLAAVSILFRLASQALAHSLLQAE